ncbi:hypothetical protein FRC00_013624 [Tulasnella sp. 408]|nr:hypothetical protein FRC00_013624 [Tulasnella sp. 408]
MAEVAPCGPSDEGLDDLIQDLFHEPLCLSNRDAWQSFFFSLNPSNSETSRSGRWRRGAGSNEVATVRLFGWVHQESMLGPYGSLEHGNLRWFEPLNMAKTQKQIIVLYLPPEIDPRSPAARFMNSQGRSLYYIMREKAGQPPLDQVMEDESRERPPTNRTNAWITSTQGGTFVSLVSKLWQDNDINTTKSKTGGSLPRNLYSMESQPEATTSSPLINNYTMATWPNPKNLEYSHTKEAAKYRLAPLDTFDANDNPIARIDFPTALRPGTAVVVDVTMALWRYQDKKTDKNAPPTWTDTYQLIMQQIKVVKPAPDPYPDAVYMEDLGPEIHPPPAPGPSLKRRAATPPLELTPPTRKPLPPTPSKIKSNAARAHSPPWPLSSTMAGPSTHARGIGSSSMVTQPATPPHSTQPDASHKEDPLLLYDSDNGVDQMMEDSTSSKPKPKAKGKGKAHAK